MADTKASHCVSEERKIRKPLMEKKRRARINESLEHLKQIILECDPENAGKRNVKLEKADILEMTVKFLHNMRKSQRYQPYTYRQYHPQRFSPPPTQMDSVHVQHSYNYEKIPVSPMNVGQFFYGGAVSFCKEENFEHTEEIWRPW
nr:unnamed protein product [Callosobruchus analis]